MKIMIEVLRVNNKWYICHEGGIPLIEEGFDDTRDVDRWVRKFNKQDHTLLLRYSNARDFQQKKVYVAEETMYPPMKHATRKRYHGSSLLHPRKDGLTLKECQALVDRIIRHPLAREWREIDYVDVTKGKVNALGYYFDKKIALPKWARIPPTVIHETCHLLIDHYLPWHGVEFTTLFLGLVREFIGVKEALELEASFIQHKVKYNSIWK